ncbi:UBX domain-containing protein 7 isoform X1 [Macrobrachium rosenbergii]|uniref:UBX domain-containing protein 7 isoform X1 n=2 Tax=Macrobrachium rosenbergii TaxID=79674 RepID=UPI0034D6B072
MPPNKSSRSSRSLIDEFCTITGADKSLAGSLLEACGNNLEMAINMHMEGVQEGTSATSNSNLEGPARQVDEEEEVRAPIPQKQEVLVEGPEDIAYTFRKRRRVARSVFDKFRDFEAETKRQEEELMAGGTPNEFSGDAGPSTSSSLPNASHDRRKMKTLEDLFRPPMDLIFRGTFQAARDHGVSKKRWLMVNVQDSSEFPCQVLNRDVWSNQAVKTIINEHFVFWQVYHDSKEGQRYMMFYQVSEWPHVAILDPRTGECLVTWHKLDALTFCDLVTEFLSSHTGLDESTSPPKKKSRPESNSSILEADEASQIEAAIKASLAETETKECAAHSNHSGKVEEDIDDEDDGDGLETFDSDVDIDYSITENKGDEKVKRTFEGERKLHVKTLRNYEENGTTNSNGDSEQTNSCWSSCSNESDWESYLGSSSDPESKLMLRLPDGSRDIVSMPCSSKLMALVKYVGSKGYSNEQYELVTNFPRKEISYMDFDITLKDAGLYPQETVFIQAR